MQEDAWMCVSTCSGGTAEGGLNRDQHPVDCSSGAVLSANLPNVVEVSVGDLLLSGQLLHLVQEDVHLELGAQVLEATVAERLPAEVIRRHRQTVFQTEEEGKQLCRALLTLGR